MYSNSRAMRAPAAGRGAAWSASVIVRVHRRRMHGASGGILGGREWESDAQGRGEARRTCSRTKAAWGPRWAFNTDACARKVRWRGAGTAADRAREKGTGTSCVWTAAVVGEPGSRSELALCWVRSMPGGVGGEKACGTYGVAGGRDVC